MRPILTRHSGRSGIQVSPLGFGCWAIGGPWADQDGKPRGMGQVEDAESIRAIHCALDHGVTFFDTADCYGAGHSEIILGRALQGRRDRVVIASKFGNIVDEERRAVTMRDGLAPSREMIKAACRESLRRLNTDYIDLYQLHIWSIPFEDVPGVLDALDELVADGLIRSYAWSTDLVEGARLFAQREHCSAVQFELNVLQEAQELLALCEEFDLAGVIRSPLAMGLLSGKYDENSTLPLSDTRRITPDWMKYFKDGKPSPDYYQKMQRVRDVLTSEGRSLVQGALAWVWARSQRAIPIPGFKTVRQVEENVAAMQFGPLTPGQMREIDALLGRSSKHSTTKTPRTFSF